MLGYITAVMMMRLSRSILMKIIRLLRKKVKLLPGVVTSIKSGRFKKPTPLLAKKRRKFVSDAQSTPITKMEKANKN